MSSSPLLTLTAPFCAHIFEVWSNSIVGRLAILSIGAWLAFRIWCMVPPLDMHHDEPPCYPYSIPFLGHSVSFALNANKVFDAAARLFGIQPYTLKIAGEKHYIFTDPQHVATVFKNSKTLTFDAFAAEHVKGFYGIADSPDCSVREFIEGGKMMPNGEQLMNIHQWFRTQLSGRALEDLTSKAIHEIELGLDVQQKQLPADGSFIEVNFSPWLRNSIGIPVTNAAFGPGLLRKFPRLFDALWEFDDGTWKMLYQLPRYLAKEVYDAREELADALRVYVADNAEGVKLREGATGIAVGRIETMRSLKFSVDSQARMAMPVIQGFQINSAPIAFWCILHIVLTPGLLARVRQEVAPAYSSGTPDIDYLNSHKTCPLLHSVFSETLRFASATIAPRQVEVATSVGGYNLRPGTKIFCPGRPLQMSTAMWGQDARSFNPERFLDKPTEVNGQKMRPFGGGPSSCPGRNFAVVEVKVFVVSALMRFDFEFPDGMPKMDLATPTLGTMHATGPARARISRRKEPLL